MSYKYNLKMLSESEFEDWDKLVNESHQGTLFHKTFWLKSSNLSFKILGCFSDNEIIAGIPITYQKRFGFILIRPPYLTPYLNPIFKNDDSKYVTRISKEKEITRSFAETIRKFAHFAYIQLGYNLLDIQPFIWEGFASRVSYTYLLNIGDLETVWNNIDSKRRNDIKRAEKDVITVEVCSDFDKTFALVEKTFFKQGKDLQFKTTAYRYNDVLTRQDQCRSFLAINGDGKEIAVIYIVWDDKRSYYLLGGYDHEQSHHGASSMAMWEAIKFTKENLNLNEFDFEGSMVPQIEQFFRKFGGHLIPCYTTVWCKPYIEPFWLGYELLKKRYR